jgi:hypothetical protein
MILVPYGETEPCPARILGLRRTLVQQPGADAAAAVGWANHEVLDLRERADLLVD